MAVLDREISGRGADLRGAALRFAPLVGADLQGANLKNADLRRVTLRHADLKGADLEGANLQRANVQGANLQGTNLCQAVLLAANLRGADLTDANLADAVMCTSDLELCAKVAAANLKAPPVPESQLSMEQPAVDLKFRPILEFRLREEFTAFISDPELRAKLVAATAANLTGVKLTGARYSDRTQWPPGFDPQQHGAVLVRL